MVEMDTVKDKAKTFLQGTIGTIIIEMIRLFPDSLVTVSGLYALLTFSFPFAMFFLSMIEANVFYQIIRYGASYLNMAKPYSTASSYMPYCRSGFTERPDFTSLSALAGDSTKFSFPSYSLYMFVVAATYLFSSLNALSKELEALGPAYSSRYYTSLVFLSLLGVVLFSFRLAYGCDGFFNLLLTTGVAIAIGALIAKQNVALLGTSSMNLIGVPLLRNRTATGQPLYICR